MRILVTGATGFVGCHLMSALSQRLPHAQLYGYGRALLLNDPKHCVEVVQHCKPTHVVHLAGQASVPQSFAQPLETYQLNVQGTANLLEAVYRYSPCALVLVVGSADPYGASFRAGQAVTEETPFAPLNPYAGSKAAAEMVAMDYAQRGLNLLRLRPFNHTGPGQSDSYVVSTFARQIAEIQLGIRPAQVETGNLDAERDFSDVRDIVAGYLHLLVQGEQLITAGILDSGTALNLGSGVPRTIASVLKQLIGLSGLEISHRFDSARMRPSDIPCVQADVSRMNQLGWQCQIDWQLTLNDLLCDWRQRLQSG
ncbi:MAG: GDP-mannose 4,6-dehydratase [Marinobacterium sp.]|nr:GDP-mannose 4,6-dehydratase [Marinobacterium sp.]